MNHLKNKIFILLSVTILFACSSVKTNSEKSNEKDGVIKTYGKNGKLYSEITMKNGKRNGISKNFYANEKVSLEINYKDDKKDGLFKQYYEDGTLSKEFLYKDSLLDGISKKFRKDGTPAWQARFEKDMPCVGLIEYYLNGTKKEEYPSIVLETIDQVKELGDFTINIRLSDNSSAVKFYIGHLTSSGCFDETKVQRLFLYKGKFSLQYNLAPGQFLMEEISIIAVAKTIQGNSYITTKNYNLSITN